MALKDTWVDLEDAIEGLPDSGDEVSAEPINDIAHSVIAIEKKLAQGEIAVKTPYIGENGNWFEWSEESKAYVDTGVQAQGKQGPQGVSGLPTVIIDDRKTSIGRALPAYSETRFMWLISSVNIWGFKANTENPNNNMWGLVFKANPDGFGTFTVPDNVVWAVAEPVFTAGYAYYLSFVPFTVPTPDEVGVDEEGYYKGKILGAWIAKKLEELS